MSTVLREIISPTATGDLDGLVVSAVSGLPWDIPPSREGNDEIHSPEAREVILLKPDTTPASPGARVVPFVRSLRRGSRGEDVIAVQRALRAAGVRKMRPTGVYRRGTVAQVKAFQRKHGLDATGKYGPPTHHKLSLYFDAYGAWLMFQAYEAEREPRVRARIAATALFGVAHREQIHYSQGPQRLNAVREKLRPPRFPVETDCSGFATWCYQVAGAPDPNGHSYDTTRAEYTGSMAVPGRRVPTAQIGDLVLYGREWPYEHVTVALDSERCVSHGSEPGPMVLPIRYRSDLAMIRNYL